MGHCTPLRRCLSCIGLFPMAEVIATHTHTHARVFGEDVRKVHHTAHFQLAAIFPANTDISEADSTTFLSVFANLTLTPDFHCTSLLNKVPLQCCLCVCVQRSLPLVRSHPFLCLWEGGQSHCLAPTTHAALHRKQPVVAAMPSPPVPRSHHCSGAGSSSLR